MDAARSHSLGDHPLAAFGTILESFEEAWQAGKPPDLGQFLRTDGTSDPELSPRRKLAEELVKLDLEFRWRRWAGREERPAAGEDGLPDFPLVEDYFRRYPEVGPADRLPLDLIAEEYRVRLRWGDRPSAESYESRFAGILDRLRQRLAAVRAELAVEDGTVTISPEAGSRVETPSEWSREVTVESVLRVGPAFPTDVRPGRLPTVPGYDILAEIGRGGMGVVYKARHLALDRLVALKMILAGPLASPQDQDRFRREAEAVARLQHANIVQIYDVGEYEGEPFLSLEFVEGQSLSRRQNGTPLPAREAAGLVMTLARTMQAAHERGIIHRDLKPANVLIAADGTPKITDFGLAKRVEDPAAASVSGAVMGTPSYMAPEQVGGPNPERRGRREIGPATDVYALGAILYELLTGRPPFKAASPMDTLLLVLTEDLVPPCRLQPRVPRELETICLKCLERNPPRRYGSANSLADDLERWLNGEPIKARPISLPARALKWARRKPSTAGLVGMSIFSGVLLVGGLLLYARQETQRAKEAESQKVIEIERIRAQEGEKLAKVNLEEALARHYHLQLSNVEKAIVERRLQDAADILPRFHSQMAGWEAKRLGYEVSLQPFITCRLSEHTFEILNAAVDPAETRLVSSGAEGQLLVWDLRQGRLLRKLQEGRWDTHRLRLTHFLEKSLVGQEAIDFFPGLCWRGQSSQVATASLQGLGCLFDTETGQRQVICRDSESLFAVACTENGSHCLFGGASGRLHLCSSEGAAKGEYSASKSPITAIRWWEGGKSWLVGREDGWIQWLDGLSLAVRGSVQVPGPVWALDVAETVGAGLFLVGCQRDEFLIFRGQKTGSSLQLFDTFSLPKGETKSHAVQAVRFDPSGHRAWGIDDTGRLILWDRKAEEVGWVVRAVGPGPLGGRVNPKWPPPFQRAGAAVLLLAKGAKVLTAGRDAMVKIWDVPSGKQDEAPITVGPQPQIAFDPSTDHLMWCLGDDGVLHRLDSNTRKELTAVPAHPKDLPSSLYALAAGIFTSYATGNTLVAMAQLPSFQIDYYVFTRPNGLAVDGQTAEAVTAGKDGRIRFWQAGKTGIRPSRDDIVHSRPIFNVALSHNRRWVAAVDAGGVLSLWERDTGKLVAREALAGYDFPPLTGKVAFNCDDTRLAAFGPGQTCAVFTTEPFQKIPRMGAVAGNGGTALLWHPQNPDVLLFADDFKRVAQWTASGKDFPLARLGEFTLQSSCVSMTNTPDGRRWFILEEGGRLLAYDPVHLGDLFHRQGTSAGACDCAIDRNGERLAVAHIDGSISFWETRTEGPEVVASPPQPNPPVPPSASWEVPGDYWLDSGKGVLLDETDRVAMLLLKKEKDPKEVGLGTLYFAREGEGPLKLEKVSESVQHNPLCFVLRRGEGNQLLAFFRKRLPDKGPYTGTLNVAKRDASGRWATEEIPDSEGNFGFYPFALTRGGNVSEIFHYHYGGFLLRTFRGDKGWDTEPAGWRGDGLALNGLADGNGRGHFLFQARRFEGDRPPVMYGRWDGNTFLREPIDPHSDAVVGMTLDPNGNPVAVAKRPGLRGNKNYYLARRQRGTWTYEPIPFEPTGDFGSFQIDPKGRMFLLASRESANELTLWQGEKGQWRPAAVVETSRPFTVHALHLDSKSRPVIWVGGNGETSWFEVFRPRAE